jgi:hypothetical protein
MTSLSPQAQAVLDASNLHPCKDSCLILAAALRAAADQVVPEPQVDPTTWTQCAFLGVREDLLAIAAELEGVKYGTYRCELEGK